MQKKQDRTYHIHVKITEKKYKEIAYLAIDLGLRNDSKAEFLRLAADHYINYLKEKRIKN